MGNIEIPSKVNQPQILSMGNLSIHEFERMEETSMSIHNLIHDTGNSELKEKARILLSLNEDVRIPLNVIVAMKEILQKNGLLDIWPKINKK